MGQRETIEPGVGRLNLVLAKWRAWAREFDSADSSWRFVAQLQLYENLKKLGFSPHDLRQMSNGDVLKGLRYE